MCDTRLNFAHGIQGLIVILYFSRTAPQPSSTSVVPVATVRPSTIPPAAPATLDGATAIGIGVVVGIALLVVALILAGVLIFLM